ncbi:MAG: Ig-like domain-containing protein [Tannerella sp.]|jgi:hypothetical protein|nr:Ig-like domain-containing protein [Tannerella sp.]
MNRKHFLNGLYILVAGLCLAGCEKRLGEGVVLKDILAGDAVRVNIGEKVKAQAWPVPWDCTDYEFTWESADPLIATVDNFGRVTSVDVGNTVIYVSQGNIRKEIPVEVYEVTLAEKLQKLGVKALWEFQDANSLFKATIGPDLVPVGSGFVQTDGYNRRTKAIVVPCSERVDGVWNYNHFIYSHGFAANGGGKKVNEFTVLIDCKFPGGPTGTPAWENGKYYCLYQTATDNTSDGDFFWRPRADYGITGLYTSSEHLFVKDTWYRFIISVQLGQELKYFLDGVRHPNSSPGDLDGERAWNPDGVLLFADNDGEDGQGFPLIVAKLAIFDRALTEEEIKSNGIATF